MKGQAVRVVAWVGTIALAGLTLLALASPRPVPAVFMPGLLWLVGAWLLGELGRGGYIRGRVRVDESLWERPVPVVMPAEEDE